MARYEVRVTRKQYVDVVVEADSGLAAMEAALDTFDENAATWWTGDLHSQMATEIKEQK